MSSPPKYNPENIDSGAKFFDWSEREKRIREKYTLIHYLSREKEEWKRFLDEQVQIRSALKQKELENKRINDLKDEQRM